jgi:DNA polymerase-3 subunit epsilon
VLLPRAADVGRAPVGATGLEVSSRPEFYDFDLFTPRPQTQDWNDRRLEDLSFTVFDTETTGLDPAGGDRIVAIGAVRVVNGRVLRQETFERLVQPHRPVPASSTAIHGITPAMLEGQPSITEVLPAFSRFAEDTVLVGHNVSFDLQFIKLAEVPAGVALSQPALDTLLLDAALHPDHEDHSLESIASRLGVSVIGRHTALGDALVTADIFVGLLSLLRRREIATLGQAIEAARETYHARVNDTLYGG